MNGQTTVADRILQFNQELAETTLELPPGFAVLNPFSGPQKERVHEVTTAFYRKYYRAAWCWGAHPPGGARP
jgi:hypothetical protein